MSTCTVFVRYDVLLADVLYQKEKNIDLCSVFIQGLLILYVSLS